MSSDTPGPLSEFTLSDPEKVASVGNQLIDEFEQISELYPNAAEAQNAAEGDIDAFFEIADLDAGSRSAQVVEERIRWIDEALRAWVDFVTNTGLISHNEIRPVLERINLESTEDS